MRVLITGGSGFVGTRLLEVMAGLNRYEIIAATRQPNLVCAESVKKVLVDGLLSDTHWADAVNGCDVVIHCAARVHVMNETSLDSLTEFRKVNVEGTMNLARQAVAAGASRFVYLSSIKVNGEETFPGKPYRADDLPMPLDPYGVSKKEAEDALTALSAETGMEIVVIRPVLVYGPGVKANFLSMMRWLDKGIPLPLGAINNRRSLVALDNLIDFIITCIDHKTAANQTFLVSDGEDVSTSQLLVRMARALNVSPRLLPVPSMVIAAAARLLGKRSISQRLCGSLQVDISKNSALLGWSPPIAIDTALKHAAAYFQEQKK